jgi:photosystem II stability/assembly factor-like uncharacterized protein
MITPHDRPAQQDTTISRRDRALTRVGAALAVLLLIVGFAGLLLTRHPTAAHTTTQHASQATATPTPRPQPTPFVTGSLAWHAVTLPSGFDAAHNNRDVMAVSPADGNTAYACFGPYVGPSAPPQLWLTHDGAATWRQVITLPGPPVAGSCTLTLDALDPQIAVYLVTSTGDTGLPDHAYITRDGGVTWDAQPGPPAPVIGALATAHGTTYALRSAVSSQGSSAALYVSSDGMRTWRLISGHVPYNQMGFWLDPATGALLLLVNTGDVGQELWTTRDGGRSWSQLPAPSMNYIVGTPAGHPWHICGFWATPGAARPNRVRCSTDGGYTWTAEPDLDAQLKWPDVFAIAADGALLAEGTTDVSQSTNHTVYRLAPHASRWQALGQAPPQAVFYAAEPGKGLLWSLPEIVGLGDYPQNLALVTAYPA